MITCQKTPDKQPHGQKPLGQKPPDNKPPRIIEEVIAKYAVDTNLFRLWSISPKKNNPAPGIFSWSFIPGAYCRGGGFCPGAFDLELKKYIGCPRGLHLSA